MDYSDIQTIEHDILVIQEKGTENISKFPLGPENNIVKG